MATMPGMAPPRPIPIKDRASILFIERGQLDVLDGAFVVVDKNGVRTHIPVGGLACLMLEPGARVSHAAVALAARACSSGLAKPASGCTRPVNPVARVPTACFTRRDWRWTETPGSRSFAKCTTCDSASLPHNDARSISCVASKARE